MSGRAAISMLALFLLIVLRTVLGPPDIGALIPLVGIIVIFGAYK